MATYQDVCDRARLVLTDPDKDRYTDAELLGYANTAVRQVYASRPDLRFGQYDTELTDAALADEFPLPARFVQIVADYLVFRAESKDDEHVNSGRSAQFGQLFTTELQA